jgi:hypothetical protein
VASVNVDGIEGNQDGESPNVLARDLDGGVTISTRPFYRHAGMFPVLQGQHQKHYETKTLGRLSESQA